MLVRVVSAKPEYQGRRKHGNDIPWSCSGRSSGELSGPFASKPHIFMCSALKLSGIVRANFALEHCHSHPVWVPNDMTWVFRALVGCTPSGSCNNTRLLEGFLEGSLIKEVLPRRRLARASVFLEGGCHGRPSEGA